MTSIRELAAEAKNAADAQAKAEKKRLWALNAAQAEQTVLDLLGVKGKATRAHNNEVKDYGHGSVVRLEDDLFVVVTTRTIYGERHYTYGERPVLGTEAYLLLCDAQGYTVLGTIDHKITSLATLDDALKAHDAAEAKKAATAAWAAEVKAARKA